MDASTFGLDLMNAGNGMAAASGGAGGGGMSMFGAVWDFADKAVGAWTTYYGQRANAQMQKIGAKLIKQGAQSHLDASRSLTRQAGEVQQAGEDAAVNRYLQLGQDIGRIYAGAAGSGIDVSSKTVGHVDEAARTMAARDVAAMNKTTQGKANQLLDQALQSRLAYISDMTQAKMQKIQASYSQKIAKSQMRSSIWNAAEGLIGPASAMFLL